MKNAVWLFARKDFRSLQGSYWWLMPACLVLYLMMGGGGVIGSGLSFLPVFWVYLGCYNLCLLEERYQVNRQNFLLPGKLSQVVAGRYLFAVGVGAAMAAAGAVVNWVACLVSGQQSHGLAFFLLSTLATAVTAALMLTPYYALGAQRSRFVALIVYVIGFAVLPQVVRSGSSNVILSLLRSPLWPVVAAAGALLVLLAGYRLSVYFYTTRRIMERA